MKRLLPLLFLGTTLPVFASGFYLGGQLGLPFIKGDMVDYDTSYRGNFFTYGAFGGYQIDFSPVFFALEADLTLADLTIKNGTPEYKKQSMYGISGLIGASINQQIDIYGRVGGVRSKFKLRDSSNSSSLSQYENGLSLGLGGRIHLREPLSLRIDYRYNRYNQPVFAGYTSNGKVKEHLMNVGLQYQF